MITTTYPSGGTSRSQGGNGIFYDEDNEVGLNIWVDTDLKGRGELLKALEGEGANISTYHWAEDTHLLILSPRSVPIFDMYCHPDWLSPNGRLRYTHEAAVQSGEEWVPGWTNKVLLKAWWIDRCLKSGKFLGEKDGWGGCRAGGPPTSVKLNSTSPPQSTAFRLPTPQSVKSNSPPPSPRHETVVADQREPDNHGSDEAQDVIGDNQADMDIDPSPHPPVHQHSDTVAQQAEEADDARQANMEVSGDQHTTLAGTAKPRRSVESSRAGSDEKMEPEYVQGSSDEEVEEVETVADRRSGNADGQVATGGGETVMDGTPAPEHMEDPSDEENIEVDEAESGEGEISENEASAPLEERSAAAAVQDVDDMLPAPFIPDTPNKLFEGLRFWVDPRKPSRKEFLSRITAAGGKISVDYAEATHVLVQPYIPAEWDPIIQSIVQLGVWFMPMSWVTKCLEDGKRYPELGSHIPGGAPVLLGLEEDQKPSIGSKFPEKRMENEEIAKILKGEADVAASMTATAFAHMLAQKYGTYSETYWLTLMGDWRRKSGRFQGYMEEKEEGRPKRKKKRSPSARINPAVISDSPNPEMVQPVPESSAVPKTETSEDQPFTIDKVDDIFREAYVERQNLAGTDAKPNKASKIAKSVSRIMQIYGVYDAATWRALQDIWASNVGVRGLPIRETTPEPKTKTLLDRYEELTRSIRPKPLPLAQMSNELEHNIDYTPEQRAKIADEHIHMIHGGREPGLTLRQLARWLAAAYNGSQKSWRRLLRKRTNHYVQGKSAVPIQAKQEESDAVQRSEGTSSVIEKSSQPTRRTPTKHNKNKMSSEDLIKIFNNYHQLADEGMSTNDIATQMLQAHDTYSLGTWCNYFNDWKRGTGRFATTQTGQSPTTNLPASKPCETVRSASVELVPSKRSVDSDFMSKIVSQNSKRPKSHHNAYTEEEERKMGRFVASIRPEAVSYKNWGDFAVNNPHRSQAAWAEHYRTKRAVVDEYANDILGNTKQSPRERSASKDSDVMFLDPPTDNEDVDYVDMTGLLSSDDE